MKRILIVDDMEPVRLVLREKLEMQGYTCQEAENGMEALESLQTTQFDLVITDNQMPVMTGLELIQSLANKPTEQRPPIILLTGHPSHHLYSEAQQAGALGVFKKPYEERELFSEISSILELRKNTLPHLLPT
jgi:two-component system chemotaxis response regulator CheY